MEPRVIFNRASRLLYDAIALNVAMVLAVFVHYLSFLFREYQGFQFTVDFYLEHTSRELALWGRYTGIYTPCAILLLWFFGVYNLGRFKRFRQRVLFVCLGILNANLFLFLLFHFSLERDHFPRGVTILFLVFTLMLVGIPRLSKPMIIYLSRNMLAPENNGRHVRRVLIIGGGGYIGSVLARYLLSEGYYVNVLDIFLFGEEPVEDLKTSRRFKMFRGDFRNLLEVGPAMEGVDAVIHLGGLVGDPSCAVNDDLTIDINYAATKMLLELCKIRGVRRFVFASTCSVYGVSEDTLTERSGLNPVSLYAKTKIDSENILLDAASPEFCPTILRFATVFGLSPRQRFDLVVNTFVAHALTRGEVTVFGGNQWRPFIHVFDIARCIELVLAAELKRVSGEVFNVGDNRLNFTINQIAEKVAELIPNTNVENLGSTDDPRNYRVAFDKIFSSLGFRCSVGIEEGIQELVHVYREEGQIDTSVDRYNNFNQVKHMVEVNSVVAKNRLYKAELLSESDEVEYSRTHENRSR